MRDLIRLLLTACFAVLFALLPSSVGGVSQAPDQTAPPAAPQSEAPAPPLPASPPPQPAPSQLPAPPPSGPVVVIDPGHGGTDSGARGPNGVFEKNIALQLARTLHAEFERQGLRAILTRNDDSNPSYDDRAGIANAYRDVMFISLHVSSTGTANTARTYYDELTPASAAPATSAAGVVAWDEAQLAHLPASERLARLIQLQLTQSFPGSPTQPSEAPIRQLRSIEGPAIAIELSSVAASSADMLVSEGQPLASAIVRSVEAYRSSGAN